LAGPAAAVLSAYTDRCERLFREPNLVGGRRVKLLSQRNTLAVDHHHPLRALAPLGFSDFRAPFFAGAKLPSRNDSLQSSCSRWFSSARNARQMVSQTPCSSQSRSRRQHVAGEGNSSGKSCQRAPLRKSKESLRTLCDRWQVVCRHGGAWAVSEARDRSSPTGRRSAVDRIAPSVLPWRCCPNLSRIFDKLTINLSIPCTQF